MIKTPVMAKQINKRVWVTIIDILRFATPVLLFVMTLMFNSYKERQIETASAIEKQSEKLEDIHVQLAQLLERSNAGTVRIDKLDLQVADISKIANKNVADIQYLLARSK